MHACGRGRSISFVKDASVPEHVVDDEQSAGTQFFLDDRQGGRVGLLIDVIEDDVELTFDLLQRPNRLRDVELDEVRASQIDQVPARLLREILLPDGVVDDATAVFLERFGKPCRGITVARTQFKNRLRLNHPRQLKTIISARRTDDGKIIFFRVGFHLQQFFFSRRDERSDVFLRCRVGQEIVSHFILLRLVYQYDA